MKYALACILILEGCALAWAYQNHPEAFQDALADINHAPNGTRAVLEQTQKKCTELSAANESLQKEDDDQKANLKTLNDQVTQLKAAAVIAAEVSAPSAPAPVASRKFTPPSPVPKQANWTWTTTDGKTYKNVVILKVEADCVTILDDEGGARIYIVTLPPDIQKLLNYDPELARVAGEARVKNEIENQELLAAEKMRTQQQLKTEAGADQKIAAPTLSDSDKQVLQQQILNLQSDIRQKAREIASNFANDGYTRTTSHSTYEDAIDQDAQQVNNLRAKLGLPATSSPVFYPYYPYYYYYLP